MKLKFFFTNLLITVLCFALLTGGVLAGYSANKKDHDGLKKLTTEVKTTADAAATAGALANAVAELNAVKIIADAAATKEALSAAEAALQALVASGDSSNQEAINLLNTAINELKSGKADVSVLNETKNELQKKISDNSTLIGEINAVIDALNETYATDAELGVQLETVKAELKALVDANKAAINALDGTYATDAALAEAEAALNTAIQANKDLIAANKALIDALDDTYATDAALATAKTELQNKITAVETSVSDLTASHTALAAAAATKAELEEAVEGLESAAAAMKAELEAKITALDTKLTNAVNANKNDIATLRSELNKISDDLTALTAKVNGNETAIGNLQVAVDAISKLEGETKLVTEIKKIQAELAKCATTEELEAVANELKALIAAKANATDVNAVKTSLEGALAEITAIKNNYTTTAAMNAAIAAAKGELTDATTQLETTLKGRLDELNDALTALTNKQTGDITGVQTSITGLQTALDALSATVESLQNADFSDKYNYASKVLMGIVEEIEEEDVGFSLADFDALVESISPSDYAEEHYNIFKIEAERERFYLNRALTVEEIRASFGRLNNHIDNLPTLLESIQEHLDKVDGSEPAYPITNTPEFEEHINKINGIYVKLDDENKKIVETRYTTILAAYENLLNADIAADAVINEIAAIAPDMVYGSSETVVGAAETSLANYKAQYFADEAVTRLYGEGMTAEAFVTNSDTLAGYREELDALQAAFDAKPDKLEMVENYATVKPLYSDFEELSAHQAAINAWKDENNINPTNMSAMYGDEYLNNVEDAVKFANHMNTIYTTYNVEALVEELKTLCAPEYSVAYTDAENVKTYRETLDNIKDDVSGYASANGSINDRNFDEMIDVALREQFAAVETRVAELVEAKGKFEALLAEMNNYTVAPEVESFVQIEAFKTQIDTYCKDYKIVADDNDANYKGFVKAADEKQAALVQEYKDITAEISAAYSDIKDIVSGVTTGSIMLSDGIKLQNLTDAIIKLFEDFKLENDNIILMLNVDGVDEEVHLGEALNECYRLLPKYAEIAKTAQEEAAALSTRIDVALALNEKDIKNVNAINEVMNAVIAWLETYVYGEEDGITYSARLAEITDLVVNGVSYTFLSVEEYENIVAHKTAVNEHKTAAEAAWPTVSNELDRLTGSSMNIHENFDEVEKMYSDYLATYYDSAIDASTECFGEHTKHSAFVPVMDDYTAKKAEAVAKAEEIKNAIIALDYKAIDASNAAEAQAEAQAIREKIAAYEETYGCDILTCSICGISDAMIIDLVRAEAISEYNVAYNNLMTNYAEEIATGAYDEDIEALNGAIMTHGPRITAESATIETINRALSVITTKIKDIQQKIDPSTAQE